MTNNYKYDIGTHIKKNKPERLNDLELADVLKNLWKPDNTYKFEAKTFGSQSRMFNLSWLERWSWLAFSNIEKGAFCKYCVLFYKSEYAGKGMHSPPTSLVTQPFCNWKHAISIFNNHQNNEYHKFSKLKAVEFSKIIDQKQNDVIVQMHKRNEKEIKNNREVLKTIIKTIELCGRQGLALRGGHDFGELSLNTPIKNDGNFRSLLRYRIESGDNLLLNHIQNCNKNASYISANVQNDIVSVISEYMQHYICDKIRKEKYFTILADETTDISHVEQFSLCIRYLEKSSNFEKDNTYIIREDFLQFVPVHSTVGSELANTIISTLTSLGLNLKNARGQGYDGAANMRSAFRGVQAVIMKQFPKALYTHCFAHCLNLCLNDASKVQQVRNALGVVQEVSACFRASAKRSTVLRKKLESKSFSGLKKFCETRWVERHESILILVEGFIEIISALEELMSIEHDKAVFPLHKSMCNFNFIITICILEKVLGITYFISKYLQTENIDLSIAIESVELTIQKLQDLRTEETFFSIFHRACEIAKEVGTSPTIPRVVGTQKHRENYAILNNDHVSYYRQSLYYPYLDDILASFNERFKMNSNIFISLSSLLPSKIGNLSFSDIQPAIDFYEEDLRSNNQNIHMDLLKNEFEFWKQKWSNEENNLPKNALDTLSKCPEDLFPHINILLKLLAILPVSTASVERSFSSLKRIKTYLRNSTGEARLNGLALMNIHRDIQIDTDAILNMFASKKERRLDFKL